MINIKKHLFLALSIALCASLQIFAMEKESTGLSNKSGEDVISSEDIGTIGYTGSTSSESGTSTLLGEARKEAQIKKRNQEILTKEIKTLENIYNDLDNLAVWDIPLEKYIIMKNLQEYIEETSALANDMLSGAISIDMKRIHRRMKTVRSESRPYLKKK
jgi:hypothetical protein